MALNVVKIFATKLIFSCNLRLLNEDLPLINRMLAKKDQRIFYLHSFFTLIQSYNNTFLKVTRAAKMRINISSIKAEHSEHASKIAHAH